MEEKYSLRFRVCNWIYRGQLLAWLLTVRASLFDSTYYYKRYNFRREIWDSKFVFDKFLCKVNHATDCLHYIMKDSHICDGDYTSIPLSLRFRICNLIYGDQLRNVLAIDMAALHDIYQHVVRQQFNEDIPEIYLNKIKEVSSDTINIMYKKGKL